LVQHKELSGKQRKLGVNKFMKRRKLKRKTREKKISWGRDEDEIFLRNVRIETEREGVESVPFDLSGDGCRNIFKRTIIDLINLGYDNLSYPEDKERIKQQFNTLCQPQVDAQLARGLIRRKASLQTKYEMKYGVCCKTSTYKKHSKKYKLKKALGVKNARRK
jgi:hypothetical protein